MIPGPSKPTRACRAGPVQEKAHKQEVCQTHETHSTKHSETQMGAHLARGHEHSRLQRITVSPSGKEQFHHSFGYTPKTPKHSTF